MGLQTWQAWLGHKTAKKGPTEGFVGLGYLRDGQTRQNPPSHCVELGLRETQPRQYLKHHALMDQHRSSRIRTDAMWGLRGRQNPNGTQVLAAVPREAGGRQAVGQDGWNMGTDPNSPWHQGRGWTGSGRQ